MISLPDEFMNRMKLLLGDEFEAFTACYENPRLRGLRVNTMKISPEEFEKKAPFYVKRIPWVTNGFFYGEDAEPARHPYYAAGVYYLQEPSAMTPASRLPVREGDRVLDLCAAPGGKSTELAAKLDGSGLLVSNDISVSRARALLRNLELFGAENIFVTAEKPENLAQVFTGYFDAILVDAPCSGEGMFRKSEEVRTDWSKEKVAKCAAIQREILENAYAMLRNGGYLMYSTCTFAPDEDEQTIAWFVQHFPDMKLQSVVPYYEGFRPGHPEWADGNPDLVKCVRIWPYVMEGEGHFMALLKKGSAENGVDTADAPKTYLEKKKSKYQNSRADSGRQTRSGRGRTGKNRDHQDEETLLRDFLKGTEFEKSAIDSHGDRAYLAQELPPGAGHLNFLRNGLYIGEWKKGRFEPSQPLALAVKNYPVCVNLFADDERVKRYLRGESLAITPEDIVVKPGGDTKAYADIKKGWALVTVDSYGIGWGKISGQMLKNKLSRTWMERS